MGLSSINSRCLRAKKKKELIKSRSTKIQYRKKREVRALGSEKKGVRTDFMEKEIKENSEQQQLFFSKIWFCVGFSHFHVFFFPKYFMF